MTPAVNELLLEGLRRHQGGALDAAHAIYAEVLQQDPQNPDALHLLGILKHQSGDAESAIGLISRAIDLHPSPPTEFFYNLGNAQRDAGRLANAAASFEKSLAVRPTAATHSNLANVLFRQGQYEPAQRHAAHAVRLDPGLPDAYHNLGEALRCLTRYDEANAAYEQAIRLRPSCQLLHDYANNLNQQGQIPRAVEVYKQALQFRRDAPIVHANLARALLLVGQSDQAIAHCQEALECHPDYAPAHLAAGYAYVRRGQIDRAIESFRRAQTGQPDTPEADSALLFALHACPKLDGAQILAEHIDWANRRGIALIKEASDFQNLRDPDRRIRIGYVSPDIWEHPVGRLLLPLLKHHDRTQFELACYADVLRPDALTSRARTLVDRWRSTYLLSDEALARQVREDEIDILVDLVSHMSGSRMLVLARKPAPVQISHIAYPATTGLAAIDWRISDVFLDPPGETENANAEQLIRLPRCYWNFTPPTDVPLAPPPSLASGCVTFASLNSRFKFSVDAISLFSTVLRHVPGSRLLLLSASDSAADQILLDAFAAHGVLPDRVEFATRRPREDYLLLYNRADIALDPIPYTGHTTNLDALWMGVPVVTLRGETSVGRGGVSVLSTLGLAEFIAATTDEYLRIARELARDNDRRQMLRTELRQRLESSSICDLQGYTRDVETIYRDIWRRWCSGT